MTKSNGKQLESLVALVEKKLVPEGFKVTTNERVYNDEGIPVAEFDIEIRGKVGSTEISWLIECRDRPSSGPAPGSWIEQLVGRRSRFGFNKVTAVSTTGFAVGAAEFALAQGIEVREVNALEPEEFSDWLCIKNITQFERCASLEHARILIDETETIERREALERLLQSDKINRILFKSSSTGEHSTLSRAFLAITNSKPEIFDDLIPNGDPVTIQIKNNYPDDDYFIVDTDAGLIEIKSIIFTGKIFLRIVEIPLRLTAEYRKSDTGEVISQIASFSPQSIHGIRFSTEFHKIEATGETHIILRKLDREDV